MKAEHACIHAAHPAGVIQIHDYTATKHNNNKDKEIIFMIF